MRIGINISPSAGGGRLATLDQIVDQVASFATQGFATAAFANIFGYDALTVVAVAGRAVPRIELETAVVPIFTRHPVALAQQAVTTQAAAGGRLVLGIGLSHRPVVEERWGMSFERPVEYMQEYLAILLPLIRGEAVEFSGLRLMAKTQLSVPEAAPPPVILAALGDRLLRLAGAQTDSTAMWMVGPQTLAGHIVTIITEAARQAGRRAALILAELRRRIRAELAEAGGQTEGELDDQTLAGIIARAIASALSWHLEAPEHTRNATVSSRTWRPAGGPRGGQSREETAERGPRDFEDRPRRPPPFRERNFEDRPPRGPYQERRPRDFEDRPPRGPYEARPPRGPYQERRPRES